MRPQPQHLISGLIGGYLPNRVDHYDTKTEALAAMKELRDEIAEDYDDIDGAAHEGFFTWRTGYEYAEIVPCEDPEACEAVETGAYL